jgi:hypothetical protein
VKRLLIEHPPSSCKFGREHTWGKAPRQANSALSTLGVTEFKGVGALELFVD